MTAPRVSPGVPVGYDPSDVPVYEDTAARDEAYYRAEREETPFLAVERYEGGYAITYDLLPAGCELARPARKELTEQLSQKIEAVVTDAGSPTAEVSKTVGESLGSVSLLAREETARDVAALVSRFVLDESNWVETSPPDSGGADPRQN